MQLGSDKDASALGLSRRLEDPLPFTLLHGALKVSVLVGQDERPRQEGEVLVTMHLGQLSHRLIHQVFPCDVKTAGKVVYFLVSLQLLVNSVLDRRNVPNYSRGSF